MDCPAEPCLCLALKCGTQLSPKVLVACCTTWLCSSLFEIAKLMSVMCFPGIAVGLVKCLNAAAAPLYCWNDPHNRLIVIQAFHQRLQAFSFFCWVYLISTLLSAIRVHCVRSLAHNCRLIKLAEAKVMR